MTVALGHTREVQYIARPEKPGGSVAYGGLLQLNVKGAGTYQVNLSSGAWIDVVKDGAPCRPHRALMHDGSIATLEDAIRAHVKGAGARDAALKRLSISPSQQAALIIGSAAQLA